MPNAITVSAKNLPGCFMQVWQMPFGDAVNTSVYAMASASLRMTSPQGISQTCLISSQGACQTSVGLLQEFGMPVSGCPGARMADRKRIYSVPETGIPNAIYSVRPKSALRFITQIGAEPAFRLGQRHVFSLRVVGHLIAVNLAQAEIARCGMREIQAADRGGGVHRTVFR